MCDRFDAMVSRRAYKEALSVEYAIGELEKGKGMEVKNKKWSILLQFEPL